MMEEKRRIVQHYDEDGEIKKGPWKAEEDEVLINHVRKYGPRDWSSIRSKGLLSRTGKSCRLRWVNKLRPNLKTGVKFSAEEERIVIDLQAQFGNKWARIAMYLPGRTDNDVKNFWSSRQKRLARILQTSSCSSSSATPSYRMSAEKVQTPAFLHTPFIEAPKFTSSTEEESVAFPNVMYPSPLQLDYTLPEKKLFPQPQPHLSFPQIPQLQPDFPMPLESQQDFIASLGDPSFLDEFEQSTGSALGMAQLPIVPSFSGHYTSYQTAGTVESHDAVDLDSFINELPPIDIFDHIEALPCPSEWP